MSRILILLILSTIATISETVVAAVCTGGTPSACYRDHGGANASQIAVGAGIAVAVAFPSTSNYGHHLIIYTPTPGDPISLNLAGSIFNEATHFSGTNAALRMHSIAIQDLPNGVPGPVRIWVLRKDGFLFVSDGNSKLVNGVMTQRMSDLVPVAYPEDLAGTPISLKMITVVQPPFAEPFVLGVTTQSLLYSFVPASNRWSKMSNTNYFIAYGGVYGLFALNGTSAPANQNLPITFLHRLTTEPQPPVLPVSSTGIRRLGTTGDFDFSGRNQPISLGSSDAWYLTNGFGLYRSKFTSSGWSAWARATTYAGMGPDDSPWTVADAKQLRGRRGEVMYIASTYRLRSYWTNLLSN